MEDEPPSLKTTDEFSSDAARAIPHQRVKVFVSYSEAWNCLSSKGPRFHKRNG